MAKDPRKKKRQDTPQTHQKRVVAAKKRHRWGKGTPHAGEYQDGPGKVHSIFHSSVHSHTHRTQMKLFNDEPPPDDDKRKLEEAGARINEKYEGKHRPYGGGERSWEETQQTQGGSTEKGWKPTEFTQKHTVKERTTPRVEETKEEFDARMAKERPEPKVTRKAGVKQGDPAKEKRAKARARKNKGENAPSDPQRGGVHASRSERGVKGPSRQGYDPRYDENRYVEAAPEESRAGGRAGGGGSTAEDFISGTVFGEDDELEGEMRQGDKTPRVDSRGEKTKKHPVQTYEEMYDQVYSSLRQSYDQDEGRAQQIAHRQAVQYTAAVHGRSPSPEQMKEYNQPIKRRIENADELMSRVNEEQLWKTHRGTIYGMPAPESTVPLEAVKGKKTKMTGADIHQRLTTSEKQWMQEQQDDQSSVFSQGAPQGKQNVEDYLQMRAQGYGAEEIMDWMAQGKPYRLQHKTTREKLDSAARTGGAYNDMIERKFGEQGSMKDKYAHAGGKHSDFSYSFQATGIDSMESLRKKHPEASDADLVKYRHAQRQTVDQYMLQANERWAHESRSARVRGKGSGANIEDEDRVVFFTTNMGAPAASVPANSLVGQYIIKKRKSMVVNDKQSTRKDVKGEFPQAVRDQHLIEVSTGMSLGVQGRLGVFHNTGWKAGSKRSKGYGNKAPVGASVMRDSTGQPIYDKDGNVRYTEGYTAPFSVGTDKDVGLRVFIG